MRTKKEIKFLTKLLNIEGIKVISQRQHEGIGIILQLSEELEFVRKRRSYTKRLAREIIREVLENDIHSVAKKGVVTTEEIERMLKDAAKEYLKAKPSELKRLGIDEIAVIKGKGNYCAVLIDLEKSKLIGMLAGRKQEEIRKVLLGWGKEVLEKIEEVSIDLWKGYKNVVIDLRPNAQVVADRFHVMAQINKELDAERKRERRQVEDLKKSSERFLNRLIIGWSVYLNWEDGYQEPKNIFPIVRTLLFVG